MPDMPSKNYAIMSIKKLHATGGDREVRDAFEHNMRVVMPTNADPFKQHENREIIASYGRSYREMIDEAVDEQRVKGTMNHLRKNAVNAYEVMMTYSHDVAEEIDLDRWIDLNVSWLQDTFNPPEHQYVYTGENGEKKIGKTDNVKHLILHMDESTPHLHALVVPIDNRGHFNASYYTDGWNRMAKLQTEYAQRMSSLGLERGEIGSIATPKNKGKYYDKINQAVESELPEPLPGETIDAYRDRANDVYQTALCNHNNEIVKMEQITVQKHALAKEDVEMFRRERVEFFEPMRAIAKAYDVPRVTPDMAREIKADVMIKKQLDQAIENFPDRERADNLAQEIDEFLQWQRQHDLTEEKEKRRRRPVPKDVPEWTPEDVQEWTFEQSFEESR